MRMTKLVLYRNNKKIIRECKININSQISSSPSYSATVTAVTSGAENVFRFYRTKIHAIILFLHAITKRHTLLWQYYTLVVRNIIIRNAICTGAAAVVVVVGYWSRLGYCVRNGTRNLSGRFFSFHLLSRRSDIRESLLDARSYYHYHSHTPREMVLFMGRLCSSDAALVRDIHTNPLSKKKKNFENTRGYGPQCLIFFKVRYKSMKWAQAGPCLFENVGKCVPLEGNLRGNYKFYGPFSLCFMIIIFK